MEFSLMNKNVMSSGIVGMENHQDINVHQDLLMTVKLVSVCGLIKFQNVKMKVNLNYIFVLWLAET
jgi:hypothetical protein